MEKIDEVLSSDEFIKNILQANSGEEVKHLFKEKGIDVTDEQIENMRVALNSELKKLNNMSDKEIEKIVGGSLIDMSRLGYAAQRGFGKGIAYGMWWGAGVGAAAGIVDASIKAYNGKIDSTFVFLKEVTKTALKASLLGGAAGGGIGGLSGVAYEFGEQGSKGLNND